MEESTLKVGDAVVLVGGAEGKIIEVFPEKGTAVVETGPSWNRKTGLLPLDLITKGREQ